MLDIWLMKEQYWILVKISSSAINIFKNKKLLAKLTVIKRTRYCELFGKQKTSLRQRQTSHKSYQLCNKARLCYKARFYCANGDLQGNKNIGKLGQSPGLVNCR